MKWIKLQGNLLRDERLRRLIFERGYKGLGIYLGILIQVECIGEGEMHLEQIISSFNRRVRRTDIQSVINSYGLFGISELGIVTSLFLADACSDACSDAGTKVKEQNRVEKSIEESAATDWQQGFSEHYPTLASMEQPLTESQYKKLRLKYSNEAIRRKLERMENSPGINKRYKSVYLTVNNWLRES